MPTLRAQCRLLRTLAGDPPVCHGQRVTTLDYLNDLRIVLRLLAVVGISNTRVLTHAEQQTLSERPHLHVRAGAPRQDGVDAGLLFRLYQAPPVHVLAVLSPIAAAIVENPGCVDEAVELFRRSRDAHPQNSQLRQLRTIGLQDAAHRALKGKARLTYELQINEYRSLAHRSRPYAYSTEHVPPRLNDALFEPFRDLRPIHTANLRLVVPVLLAMLCQHRHWRQAIEAVGTQQLISATSCGYALGQLRRHDLLDQFLTAVHAIASRLESCHDVDYLRQRELLQSLRPIEKTRWDVIAQRAGIRSGRNGTRRMVASAWIWQDLTQSDPRIAPTWHNHALEHQHSRIGVLIKTFAAGPLSHVSHELHALAREIASERGALVPDAISSCPADHSAETDRSQLARRHRVAAHVALTAADGAELTRRANEPHQQMAKRALVVLLAADGVTNAEIGARIHLSPDTVNVWRRRFSQEGLEGLRDRPSLDSPVVRLEAGR